MIWNDCIFSFPNFRFTEIRGYYSWLAFINWFGSKKKIIIHHVHSSCSFARVIEIVKFNKLYSLFDISARIFRIFIKYSAARDNIQSVHYHDLQT